MNTGKKVISIIGAIAGIAMIVIGFSIMNPETYDLATRNSIGGLITFGADFYTEMYAVTFRVGNAVQRAYTNICNAIGWLIVALGAFDVFYFVLRLFEQSASYDIQEKKEEECDELPDL